MRYRLIDAIAIAIAQQAEPFAIKQDQRPASDEQPGDLAQLLRVVGEDQSPLIGDAIAIAVGQGIDFAGARDDQQPPVSVKCHRGDDIQAVAIDRHAAINDRISGRGNLRRCVDDGWRARRRRFQRVDDGGQFCRACYQRFLGRLGGGQRAFQRSNRRIVGRRCRGRFRSCGGAGIALI